MFEAKRLRLCDYSCISKHRYVISMQLDVFIMVTHVFCADVKYYCSFQEKLTPMSCGILPMFVRLASKTWISTCFPVHYVVCVIKILYQLPSKLMIWVSTIRGRSDSSC